MIGLMRHRVTLQENISVADAGGGRQAVWQNVPLKAVLWASIKSVGQNETFKANQLENTITHKITTRYRADIKSGLRFKKANRYFRIISVMDIDEGQKWLKALCIEVL